MSYCRFSECDVYAYVCDGGVQFWVSKEHDQELDRLCNTFNDAYQYAKALRDEHGIDVPDHAIEALRLDALDEIERFDGSIVAELREENAVLQQQLADVTESFGRLEERNAKLRELVDGLTYCARDAHGMCARTPVGGDRPFTCCPLYGFDDARYRCVELRRELGMEDDD